MGPGTGFTGTVPGWQGSHRFPLIRESRIFVDTARGTMDSAPVSALEAIQAMLAPAVGISAVGLLLLSLGSRYSTIINRIRLLNDERRRFVRMIEERAELSYAENVRHMSVVNQSRELLVRSRYVRNAILALQTAIGFFVLTSMTIGMNLFVTSPFLTRLPLLIFITGMLAVVIGIVHAAVEVYRSYRIVLLEVKAEE